jgi:hypothetical protein
VSCNRLQASRWNFSYLVCEDSFPALTSSSLGHQEENNTLVVGKVRDLDILTLLVLQNQGREGAALLNQSKSCSNSRCIGLFCNGGGGVSSIVCFGLESFGATSVTLKKS